MSSETDLLQIFVSYSSIQPFFRWSLNSIYRLYFSYFKDAYFFNLNQSQYILTAAYFQKQCSIFLAQIYSVVLNKRTASLFIFDNFSYLHALIRYLHGYQFS